MIRTICVLFLLTICNQVLAYGVSGKTISRAHVNISSGYYFNTNEEMVNPDGCGGAEWYKLQNGTYSKEAFSVVLSAKMSGKKVDFYLDGCASGYPQVIWINVHD